MSNINLKALPSAGLSAVVLATLRAAAAIPNAEKVSGLKFKVI